MSIRLIAKDLYHIIQKVESLEKEKENAPWDRREALEFELRKARAEEKYIRSMLEAKKEPSLGSSLQTKR